IRARNVTGVQTCALPISRPTIVSAGLKWQVVRLLRTYFFGGHRGGLELGHICHNPHCVHPGHVSPISGAKNRKDRDILNAEEDRSEERRVGEERGSNGAP